MKLRIILLREIEICCGSAFGTGRGEIGSVGVEGEDHVAGAVADGAIWMSDYVVEKLTACIHDGLGAMGLLGCDCTEGSS
jgi:hypothetical protein